MMLSQEKEIVLPTHVLWIDPLPGGSDLLAACMDGGIYRVDLASGEAASIGYHASFASGVHIWKNGVAISAGYDGRVLWHDLEKKKIFREVTAHRFWSWQSALSPDKAWFASATGRYACGGYRYEPAAETEPSVKVYAAASGDLLHAFSHVPPVESIAFSRDSRYLAAANLMGEVRVWALETGKEVSQWTTPSFTGWGIIKGHYFTGGVFSLAFGPGDEALYLAGMGSTRDPAAGNGKQLWEAFDFRASPPVKTGAMGESGSGLMESLTFHPSGDWFVMGGRLESGQWNVACFETAGGSLQHALDLKARVSKAAFDAEGKTLYLAGGVGQEKPVDGKSPPFGRIGIFRV